MSDPKYTPSSVRFLTPAELRQRWKVSAMFLWRLRQEGKIKITKIGSRGVRYSLAEVERIEREAQV